MRQLSKSKLIAYRQCPKRLWLELHKAEERDDSESQVAFAVGNEVGDIAQKIYDPDGVGVNVDSNNIGWNESYEQMAERLQSGDRPIFEAALRTEGALALADVMLPETSFCELKWRMLEVKSSTSVKDYHRDDAAIQTYIARKNGIQLSQVGLAHVNNGFVYQGDGNYEGLLQVEDLTDEAMSRDIEVHDWIEQAQATAALEAEPMVEMGAHCQNPFPCAFCKYCAELNGATEDPLSVLPRLNWKRRESWSLQGIETLEATPDDELSDAQAMVKAATLSNELYFNARQSKQSVADGTEAVLFLDFETVNFAVPIWKGTRPYQQLPFQYSLHIQHPGGKLEHAEFLDLSGDDPREALARQLIRDCGNSGVIYAYNMGFEKRVIRELMEAFPELAAELEAILPRVDDLLPVARSSYYHPSQKGSWSLKAVLPAICPDLDYSELEEIQHGEAAVAAYKEAIHPETTPERKEELRERMLDYCKLDTLATVEIWKYFRG